VNKNTINANPEARKTRILVVDDYPIVRDGVAELLNLEADFIVAASAGNIGEAVDAVKNQQIDLALVDMLLKNETGVEVTKKIISIYPDIIVMIFSMSDDIKHIEQAFEAGARGYIIKDEVSDKIIGAVRQVLGGKNYLSEMLAKKFPKHKLNELMAGGCKSAIPKGVLNNA